LLDGNTGMATLKRSDISFRRQGSSGLAWEENWIAAEVDGEAGGGPVFPPPPSGTTNSHRDLHYSATTASPQLRHSRSVGLIGAGYGRLRDHRGLNGLNPANTQQRTHKETGHKSQSRVLRWFKRTFLKSKT